MSDVPPDPPRATHAGGGAPRRGVAETRLARAAGAAEELCATLWEALHDELGEPDGGRVAELAERLAQVCSTIATLAREARAPTRERSAPEPSVAGPSASELSAVEPSELERPAPWRAPEIAIRDVRGATAQGSVGPGDESAYMRVEPGGEDRAAWMESIGASLERHMVDALPFAALLIEVVDVGRLAQAESAAALAGVLGAVEEAIGRELRPSDTIARESEGRWWLIASRTDSRGARTLAGRLAGIVRAGASHRGVALEVAIGVAVCPDDGRDAAALAAHAEVGLYAARAAGRPVAPADGSA